MTDSTKVEVLAPRVSTELAMQNRDTIVAIADRFMQLNPISGTGTVDKPMAVRMATMALAYGLDPALGHIEVYESKPYVTIDGMAAWADKNPHYDGYEWRYLDGVEKQDFGYAADDVVVEVLVHRKDRKHPTKEYGSANSNRPHRGNPVERTFPREMARKRALYRAIRFGLPMNMNARNGLHIDPNRDLLEQHESLITESKPALADRPRGSEWRQFWQVVGQAGLTREHVYERIQGRGHDLDYTDPETGELRASMLAFTGTPLEALDILGLKTAPDASLTAADPEAAMTPEQRLGIEEPAGEFQAPAGDGPAPSVSQGTQVWLDCVRNCDTLQALDNLVDTVTGANLDPEHPETGMIRSAFRQRRASLGGEMPAQASTEQAS